MCANEELQGRYTDKFFDKFPDQKDVDGKLYYLKLEYNGTKFFKVGITKNDVKTRRSMLNSIDELNWEVAGVKDATLYNAYLAEQEIQKTHGDKHRQEIPIEKELIRKVRLGPTECFFQKLPQNILSKWFYLRFYLVFFGSL